MNSSPLRCGVQHQNPTANFTSMVFHPFVCRNHPAGRPLSNPGAYSGLKVKTRRMNFQEPEYLLNEPWWVTVIGCVTLAAIFAFALIAV